MPLARRWFPLERGWSAFHLLTIVPPPQLIDCLTLPFLMGGLLHQDWEGWDESSFTGPIRPRPPSKASVPGTHHHPRSSRLLTLAYPESHHIVDECVMHLADEIGAFLDDPLMCQRFLHFLVQDHVVQVFLPLSIPTRLLLFNDLLSVRGGRGQGAGQPFPRSLDTAPASRLGPACLALSAAERKEE